MRGASKKIKVAEKNWWALATKVTFSLENISENIQIRNDDNCLPFKFLFVFLSSSVADPDPNPSYQYVFGPPGSGSESISQRHGSGTGSGSESFYHHANIARKTLIPTFMLLLFDFLPLKNDVNVPSKRNQQKNFLLNLIFVGLLKVNDENGRIRIRIRGSISQRHGWDPQTAV